MLHGRFSSPGRLLMRGEEHHASVAYALATCASGSPTCAPLLEAGGPRVCPDPYCAAVDVIEDWAAGTAVCRMCGIVVEEHLLDTTCEYRVFQDNDGRELERVSACANPLLQSAPTTSMQNGRGENRLRRAQNKHTTSKEDKIMTDVISRVDDLCVRLNVPAKAVGYRAKESFKRYYDVLTLGADKSTRTRSLRKSTVDDIVAASLLIACRIAGGARSFVEIERVTGVKKQKIGRVSKAMVAALPDLGITEVVSAEDFITRFGTGLNLPRSIIVAAKETAKVTNDWGSLCAKRPITIASAVIFLVCKHAGKEHYRSIVRVTEVTGVAQTTIRSTCKAMMPQMTGIIHEKLKGGGPKKRGHPEQHAVMDEDAHKAKRQAR